jgi:ABC-type iron transport system FetAB permease component
MLGASPDRWEVGPVNQTARTVCAMLALVAVAVVAPRVDGVRQGRAVTWAAGRAAVQLGAVGLVLGAVFRAPLAVLPVLAVMVVAATATVTSRLADVPIEGRWRRPARSPPPSSAERP